MQHTQPLPTGKVIIVGAGPGDADLLTIKAAKHLSKADVVLVDRLVNPEITRLYASQATIIPVGKQCRKNKSTAQSTINELLVQHAKEGRYVVRLKGGDISIFSNILDELETLVQHNIPYELVPGITAALGTAAYAGIPLTARGLSKGVRLLTYYNANAVEHGQWNDLAKTTDTLVFYMSGETCFELAAKLIEHGKPASTPVFLAEQATTPLQQFSQSSLGNCADAWKSHSFLSPALLIIGEVVSLHKAFQWKAHTTTAEEFFNPVQIIPISPVAEQIVAAQITA